MKIAICDESMADALLLREFLAGNEVVMYNDAGSLLSDIENHYIEYDLYFLDIYMEKSMNGIELAKQITGIKEEAIICFVSSSDRFYREAYDLFAVQYLLKPVQENDVKRLLDKVSRRMERCRSVKES